MKELDVTTDRVWRVALDALPMTMASAMSKDDMPARPNALITPMPIPILEARALMGEIRETSRGFLVGCDTVEIRARRRWLHVCRQLCKAQEVGRRNRYVDRLVSRKRYAFLIAERGLVNTKRKSRVLPFVEPIVALDTEMSDRTGARRYWNIANVEEGV